MRRAYFIEYYKDFANTYCLYYADTPEEAEKATELGMYRISRKDAERKCAEENYRRKNDSAMSGFASASIVPFSSPNEDFENDWRHWWKNGYIRERLRA